MFPSASGSPAFQSGPCNWNSIPWMPGLSWHASKISVAPLNPGGQKRLWIVSVASPLWAAVRGAIAPNREKQISTTTANRHRHRECGIVLGLHNAAEQAGLRHQDDIAGVPFYPFNEHNAHSIPFGYGIITFSSAIAT